MKLLNTLYLVTLFVSGALAVPTAEDVIDTDKRDVSTDNFRLSEASQPGAGNALDIKSVVGRDLGGESEVAEANELEARNGKKNRRGRKCGKKGRKCAKRGRKHRKGRKNRKAKKAKKTQRVNAY